jgi:hypothetical protein
MKHLSRRQYFLNLNEYLSDINKLEIIEMKGI